MIFKIVGYNTEKGKKLQKTLLQIANGMEEKVIIHLENNKEEKTQLFINNTVYNKTKIPTEREVIKFIKKHKGGD